MKSIQFILSMLFIGYVAPSQAQRIVSLSGTLTEIVVGLGLEKRIVGVDVTSTYPASIQKIPKVGHIRQVGAEALLSLNPTEVIVIHGSGLRPEISKQLEQAGVKVTQFQQTLTPKGTEHLIQQVATHYKAQAKGQQMIQSMQSQLKKVKPGVNPPKVLFIYARGAGSLQVSGQNTSVDQLIQLAGGKNAIQGFSDFKPLTTEALVSANPDYILLFNSGLESLGGIQGLLKIPGIQYTTAGKRQQIIEMDGLLLTGFGPRVGVAIRSLNKQLYP